MSDKIPVGILGATGSVGQKFVELLSTHPWFEICAVAASARSAGKRYGEAVNWFQTGDIPPDVAKIQVSACTTDLPCRLVFSGLDSSIAGETELAFAEAGYTVVSNAKNYRMHPDVPLLIPEVNADHLNLLDQQAFGSGRIITNPNCSVIGLVISLKPLHDAFTIKKAHVVTMQALSGAGYPGVASMDILDNIIPFIEGEEEKLEMEPSKLLGRISSEGLEFDGIQISAACNRVAVTEGHLESVSLEFDKKPSAEEIVAAWQDFNPLNASEDLPSAPDHPIRYLRRPDYPQPRLHRDYRNRMGISIGGLRACRLLDYKYSVLSHNTIRGAAGGAVLNAELLVSRGLIQ